MVVYILHSVLLLFAQWAYDKSAFLHWVDDKNAFLHWVDYKNGFLSVRKLFYQ